MYKFLLCWRYLRTRYIALASIVSVMLGVATMIVVNSVMEGFTHEMKDRIHGILSDLVFESQSLDGFPDADRRMEEIRKIAGDYISGMSPTVHIPAMLGYSVGSQYVTRQITMIGVDEATYSSVSDFGQYLQHPENRKQLDFKLKDGGYDTVDHQATDPSKVAPRRDMQISGWELRRRKARFFTRVEVPDGALDNPFAAPKKPTGDAALGNAAVAGGTPATEGTDFDPAKEQHPGCVLGIGLCAFRMSDGSDGFLALPGRRRRNQLPHFLEAPQSAQREVHVRRLLRKQNERIRLEFRVRAAQKTAKFARYGRPVDRHRELQRDPSSPEEGCRSRQGSRSVAGEFSAANLQNQFVER